MYASMHFTHVAPPERVGSRASVEVESRWRDSASYEPSQGCHKGCSSLVTHQKHFDQLGLDRADGNKRLRLLCHAPGHL